MRHSSVYGAAMKYLGHKKGRLAVIVISGITLTVFCIEYISYIDNRSTWAWPSNFNREEEIGPSFTALFVADPQIQGEQQESFLYGWISRWDADRYLSKNYRLAKQHISPDVIVFLGDLFDEGSIATNSEYRRYFQRFSTIFDLSTTNQNPSPVQHIFVPGDNDVGGEKPEPIHPVKVKWFTKTFGNFRTVTNIDKLGVDVQFIKMNLFMPNEYKYKDPLKGLESVVNGTKNPDVRFIVSHVSLLSHMTNAVKQILENVHPFLIFAGDLHKSSYIRHPVTSRNDTKSVHIVRDFLIPNISNGVTPAKQNVISEREQFHPQSSIILDFRKPNVDIHEIIIPTCSYRMGVYNMGYGAMKLYQNGTLYYTVLWLPSRFNQLFLYLGIILMILILIPWISWKSCNAYRPKYLFVFNEFNKN